MHVIAIASSLYMCFPMTDRNQRATDVNIDINVSHKCPLAFGQELWKPQGLLALSKCVY